MSKKVIVFLAEGFEEVEAVTPIDYLRRAGAEVTIAAIEQGSSKLPNFCIKGARGVSICADISIKELEKQGKMNAGNWDAVVIPGGMPGASNIAASKETSELLKEMAGAGKLVCAICASPVIVLEPLGLIAERNYTCYPGMENKAINAKWSEEKVVIDGNIITSRGAGTAGLFSAAIISKLFGEEEGEKIARAVLL